MFEVLGEVFGNVWRLCSAATALGGATMEQRVRPPVLFNTRVHIYAVSAPISLTSMSVISKRHFPLARRPLFGVNRPRAHARAPTARGMATKTGMRARGMGTPCAAAPVGALAGKHTHFGSHSGLPEVSAPGEIVAFDLLILRTPDLFTGGTIIFGAIDLYSDWDVVIKIKYKTDREAGREGCLWPNAASQGRPPDGSGG